jgi:hypothetical protein
MKRKVTVVTVSLTFRCTHCGKPISPGAGYVELDLWHLARPPFEGWRAMHRDCDPDVMDYVWWRDVAAFRGEYPAGTLEHLLQKRWWDPDLWVAFLRSPALVR